MFQDIHLYLLQNHLISYLVYLYLSKTNADTLQSVVYNTLIIGSYKISFRDTIYTIHPNKSGDIIDEQIITSRQYYLGTDTISVEFTNLCSETKGIDSLNSVFILPNGSLGIIAVNTYCLGTNSMCGGACEYQIEMYSYNKKNGLIKTSDIYFEDCTGDLIIENQSQGTRNFINKVYWSGNCIIFKDNNQGQYAFDLIKQDWKYKQNNYE